MASAWGSSWGSAWGSAWGGGVPPPPEFTGGGGSHWKKWYVPPDKEDEPEELAKIQRKVKKAVAKVISAPGILSGDLTAIVRQEVEAAPQSWLTPELINLIVTRIEAQFRRAFIRKQQEDEADDEDALVLLS